jgi:hypothetical protein
MVKRIEFKDWAWVIPTLVALFTLWVALRHEQEHRSDLMEEVGMASLWLLFVSVLSFFIYYYRHEGKKFETRQVNADNTFAERAVRFESENKRLREDLTNLQGEVGRLKKHIAANMEFGNRKLAQLLEIKSFAYFSGNIEGLRHAGECDQLAWHAARLRQRLISMFQQLEKEGNQQVVEKLSYPLGTPVPACDSEWKWYDRDINRFTHDFYGIKERTSMLSLKGFKDLKTVVTQCGVGSIEPVAHRLKLIDGLDEYSRLIAEESQKRVKSYRESLESILEG